MKMSIVEDKEKCLSTNTKRTTIIRPIKWVKNRHSTSGSEGIYLDITSYTAPLESHPVGVPYLLTNEGSIIELRLK
jgi:hypothetical protein